MGRARGVVVACAAALVLGAAVRASGQIVDDGGTTTIPVDDGSVVFDAEPIPPVIPDAGFDSPYAIDAPAPGPTTPSPDASTPLPIPDTGAGCESCAAAARRPDGSAAIHRAAVAVAFALATLRRRRRRASR